MYEREREADVILNHVGKGCLLLLLELRECS